MVIKEDLTQEDLKKERKPRKAKTPKEVKAPKTVREVFDEAYKEIDIESLKKPWMASKSFRLVDDAETLQAWVTNLLNDPSRHKTLTWKDWTGPVVAVDTETDGLDIRVVNGQVKVSLAGVCLSADGVEGLYIPVGHDTGRNISTGDLRSILQPLFDQSHLVFFNAKFDREVLRLKAGMTFADFPSYEDVQVLSYLYDPKAKVDAGAFGFQAGGLKATSKSMLGIEQIELESLTKVRARVWNPELEKYSYKMVYTPFNWLPTADALWYAAGDAICTWLLWEKLHELMDFTTMRGVHRMDHQLIDTLTWIERQRVRVDKDRLAKTEEFHKNRVQELTKELAEIAGVEDLNPGSPPQLQKILFEDKGFDILEVSEQTRAPSTSVAVLKELRKRHPEDLFLSKLMDFREYAALHPENLFYDPADSTARFYFKQNVVAGGRLAGAGGEFEKDGGCGINPQAIKKVGGNWWVKGRKIPDNPDLIANYPEFDVKDLDPSCLNKDGKLAPNIKHNHIGNYFGIDYCLVPSCPHHTGPMERVDANEVINLRSLFIAEPGWTMFSIDYSNIEMRVAANVSKEPLFIKEFNEGSGDFHTLTATALFSEFSDPNTPKARTKELRSLAKIINFALLYGGTSYTIFENLNKAGFATTREQAEEMVNRYWESVPTFAVWCQMKRMTAREKLLCKTPTGRIIKFDSAMKALRISEPTEEHRTNFFGYEKLKKLVEECKQQGAYEDMRAAAAQANALWQDPASGVKNYQEYNRFLGKAERVSINIPLQGTAGDLMRSALNHIRIWATNMPDLEKVFRLHLTVHDEIDFTVKNEFVPYVLPRINRLMKLRKLHTSKRWEVPIETDCEYGQTWDVQHHLTGDKEHTAAGWSEIPGLEHYTPVDFEGNVVQRIAEAWQNGETERVRQWVSDHLHPRVHYLVDRFTPDSLHKSITIMLQLHEFWTVDQDESDSQTLHDFAQDNDLTIPDIPLVGGLSNYLASILPAPESGLEDEEDATPIGETVKEPEVADHTTESEEEDIFLEPPPVKKPTEPKLPVLRPLMLDEMKKFQRDIGLGAGEHTFSFIYALDGTVKTVKNAQVPTLPVEYLDEQHRRNQ